MDRGAWQAIIHGVAKSQPQLSTQACGAFSNAIIVKSLSRVRLFMTPWTVTHQAPPSMEFSRQKYWSGLPFPSCGKKKKKKTKVELLVAQSCLFLCGPMDSSQPGSSVHVILEARILEWEAILFSKESSLPRDQTQPPALQADFLPSEPPVKSIIHAFLQIK